MLGNDDDFGIDPILDGEAYSTVNADGKALEMPGGLQLLASGWSAHAVEDAAGGDGRRAVRRPAVSPSRCAIRGVPSS